MTLLDTNAPPVTIIGLVLQSVSQSDFAKYNSSNDEPTHGLPTPAVNGLFHCAPTNQPLENMQAK